MELDFQNDRHIKPYNSLLSLIIEKVVVPLQNNCGGVGPEHGRYLQSNKSKSTSDGTESPPKSDLVMFRHTNLLLFFMQML